MPFFTCPYCNNRFHRKHDPGGVTCHRCRKAWRTAIHGTVEDYGREAEETMAPESYCVGENYKIKSFFSYKFEYTYFLMTLCAAITLYSTTDWGIIKCLGAGFIWPIIWAVSDIHSFWISTVITLLMMPIIWRT